VRDKYINPLATFGILLSLFGNSSASAKASANPMTEQHNSIQNECVILLHGLARTKKTMSKMETALTIYGYKVVNLGYPSRAHDIAFLSKTYLPPAIKQCQSKANGKIHIVTHSMGGILIRHYLSTNKLDNLGRVVMLSPPNQGSEVVDKLKNMPGFTAFNGPAGHQLGTDENSMPNRLGPADFDLGIITGNRTINFILSMLIPGDDDGKVSVERAKLVGMNDFLVMPHSHPFIMKQDDVITQTITYLHSGSFKH
jgi:pimeloyl-ACP methyl ester carboxylesterase